MCRPVRVKRRRLVWDLDVFDQGWDDLVVPALIDKFFDLSEIQHLTAPRYEA
jgi:hypothetical protein